MSLDALACIFATAPIQDCGRGPAVEPVLASSWPMAAMGLAIISLMAIAFLRSMFRHETDADIEVDEILDTRERRLRRAANDIVPPSSATGV